MREIKFRATYKPEFGKVGMFEVNEIEWMHNGGFVIDGEIPGGAVELMQFTGLKDKNEKEIYEGDILVEDNMRSDGIFFNVENGAFYSWWKYNKPMEGQRRDAFAGGNLTKIQAADCEVIGNIYENPALLTV